MPSVTLSQGFRVTIPSAVRRRLGIRPGHKLQIVEHEGRIELIPERDIRELRGFVKGISTELGRG